MPIPPGYCLTCHIQVSCQLRDQNAVVPIKCPRCKRELIHRSLPFELQLTNTRTPQELESFLIFLLKINTLPIPDKLEIQANAKDLQNGTAILIWHH